MIELGLAKQAAQLPKDKIVPPNLVDSRSAKDVLEENAELRKIREKQHEMIRKLEEQSACWEELATIRAELIRELRSELGQNPDAGK